MHLCLNDKQCFFFVFALSSPRAAAQRDPIINPSPAALETPNSLIYLERDQKRENNMRSNVKLTMLFLTRQC